MPKYYLEVGRTWQANTTLMGSDGELSPAYRSVMDREYTSTAPACNESLNGRCLQLRVKSSSRNGLLTPKYSGISNKSIQNKPNSPMLT